MTCTPLNNPLRCLLNRLSGTTGAPTDSLNRDGLEQARRFGWVYEHEGRVALTAQGPAVSARESDQSAWGAADWKS